MTLEQKIEIARLAAQILAGAAIPILIFIFGNRITKIRETEEKLRQNRIEIYYKVLEPFFLIFSTTAIIQHSGKTRKAKEQTGVELATEKLLTLDYQNYCFQLSLFGSETVVKAFNNLLQAYYNPPDGHSETSEWGFELMNQTAKLMIEIRKSLGNEGTKLDGLEILEWKIKDIRKYKVRGKYPKEFLNN